MSKYVANLCLNFCLLCAILELTGGITLKEIKVKMPEFIEEIEIKKENKEIKKVKNKKPSK